MRATLIASIAISMIAGCSGPDEHLPTDAAVIDAAPDGPPDAGIDADVRCGMCGPTQICVQSFNGTCGELRFGCQERNAACTGIACNPDCDFWHCREGVDAGILTCSAANCPGENPQALHCYGP